MFVGGERQSLQPLFADYGYLDFTTWLKHEIGKLQAALKAMDAEGRHLLTSDEGESSAIVV